MPVINVNEGVNVSVTISEGNAFDVTVNSGVLNGGVPGGNSNTLQYNNNGVFGGVPFTSYANGVLTLGSNANISITGGAVNQVLTTNGSGVLSWANAASGTGTVTSVTGNGSGIGFSLSGTVTTSGNITLATPTAADLRTTLTIGNVANLNLNGNASQFLTGAGTFAAGNAGTVTSVATSGSGLGFSLGGGPITSTGTVTLTVPSDTALRTSLNIGTVANINLNANGSQVLAGNGAWIAVGSGSVTQVNTSGSGLGFSLTGGPITNTGTVTLNIPTDTALRTSLNIGNVANINLNGNGGQVLAGNGAWIAQDSGTAAGSNTQIQFNDGGVFGANANFTYNKVTNTLTVGNIASVDSVTFDIVNVGAGAVAQLTWNDGDGTLDLGLKGGNVTAQLGEQEYARVYNQEATALVKGEVVYVNGAQGNRVAVRRAQANSEVTSRGTLGFVAETIASGGEGFVNVSGALYRIDTSGKTAGAPVFLSASVAGGWTTTAPASPNHLVILGWIERVDNIVGSIYVKVDNGYELDELHDVTITTPVADNSVLQYDNANSIWVNRDIAYLRTSANIGNVANTNYNGNSSQFLTGAGTFAPGNAGTVTSIATSGSGLGFSLGGGPITSTGTVALTVPTDTALRTSLNIGNVANLNLNGVATQFLTGTGTFASGNAGTVTSVVGDGSGLGFSLTGTVTSSGNITLAVPSDTTLRTNLNIGNVANINLNGNGSQVLAGNGSWVAQSGGGGATDILSPFLLMGA